MPAAPPPPAAAPSDKPTPAPTSSEAVREPRSDPDQPDERHPVAPVRTVYPPAYGESAPAPDPVKR